MGTEEPPETPGMERDMDTGQWKQRHSDKEFLTALRASGGIATSGDVARAVGCTRRAARQRLEELADDDRLDKQKVGGGQTIVWLPKSNEV